jgi:hypothetical protein
MKYAIIGLGKIDTALIARPKIPTSYADFDEFSFDMSRLWSHQTHNDHQRKS